MPTFPSSTLFPSRGRSSRPPACRPTRPPSSPRSLVDANLCGHDSHGLIRIPQYLEADRRRPAQAGRCRSRSSRRRRPCCVADGGWGLGQVQAHRLLQRLVPQGPRRSASRRARCKHCGHIGRLGEYAEAAAAASAWRSSPRSTTTASAAASPRPAAPRPASAPIRSASARPTDGDPGRARHRHQRLRRGQGARAASTRASRRREGWLLDAEGRPTTDPGVLYREPRGTILPLGGPQAYKGFGIGLLLDMFAGGLSGRAVQPAGHAEAVGQRRAVSSCWTSTSSPAPSISSRETTGRVRSMCAAVRGPRASQEILLPGDPERREKARRQKAGLTLDDGTWGQLTQVAARLKVAVPTVTSWAGFPNRPGQPASEVTSRRTILSWPVWKTGPRNGASAAQSISFWQRRHGRTRIIPPTRAGGLTSVLPFSGEWRCRTFAR